MKRRVVTSAERRLWYAVNGVKDASLVRASDSAEREDEPRVKVEADDGQSIKPPMPLATPMRLMINDLSALDGNTARRFQKGLVPIAATLDLHGLTVANAHPVFHSFIDKHWKKGDRCVLVITGKGLRSPTKYSALKTHIEKWLQEPSCAQKIVSIHDAPTTSGGKGALMFYLRRQRF